MRIARSIAAGLAIVLSVVGCTASSPYTPPPTAPPPASPSPADGPAPIPSPGDVVALDDAATTALTGLRGRLLIHVGDAGLATIRPDGSDVRVLADPTDGVLSVLDAAWSPDGRQLAWSQVDGGEGLATDRLVVTGPTGGDRVVADVDFAPFYLSWDPTSRRIGLLGNGETSVRLAIAEVRGGVARVADVAEGRPFYFSWAPDGDRVLTNRNDGGLEQIELDGRATWVDESVGIYQAPLWTPDGAAYYVRIRQGLAQELVARPTGTGPASVLAVQRGAVYFVASPDGGLVAFHGRAPDELDFYDRGLSSKATDLGVTVVDTTSGALTRWSTEPAIAWSWSPDGDRLAILEPVYAGEGPILFRWHVVGRGTGYATEPFAAPLRYLQAVVPFFTQYAQSVTMWAPDSSAFAYSIETSEGARVVVRPDHPDASGVIVAPGDSPAWSPT